MPKKPASAALVAGKLARWFRIHRRAMPWRETRDPYRIWLSEIMLQQTQVATVIPYYARFLARFPSVDALAAAPVDDVLTLWAGLGYYSRARSLHRGAQIIVERFGGRLPATRDALRQIPGIGPYTAGAILSIAFSLPEPLVDGNVARVLSRLTCLEGDWRVGAGKRAVWAAAGDLVAAGAQARVNPGDLNQALMELGATLCTPRTPECSRCPLADSCQAHQTGSETQYPQTPPKRVSPVWPLRAWVVEDARGRILFARRQAGGLFGGMWEVPTERAKAAPDVEPPFARLQHVLTHRVLELRACRVSSRSAAGRRCRQASFPCWSGTYEAYCWVLPAAALEGKTLALASVQQRLLRAFAAVVSPLPHAERVALWRRVRGCWRAAFPHPVFALRAPIAPSPHGREGLNRLHAWVKAVNFLTGRNEETSPWQTTAFAACTT